jgi:hypothetical protein
MRFMAILLVISLTNIGCSDESEYISGPPPKGERIELLPEYIYLFQGEEQPLVTSQIISQFFSTGIFLIKAEIVF